MTKAFGAEEKEQIRSKLVESYEICLNKYGIHKINIDELVKMAGISKGSFYLFYDSKEMLFVDVLDKAHERIKAAVYDTCSNGKGISQKELLKKLIMGVFIQMRKSPWLLNLNDDEYQSTLRRIPREVLIKHSSRDSADISEVLAYYGIHLNVSMEILTAVCRALFCTLLYQDVIGEHYDEAFDILADSIVSRICN